MFRFAQHSLLLAAVAAPCGLVQAAQIDVSDVAGLRAAATSASQGTVIQLAAGVYELDSSLRVNSGVTLRGAGQGQTVLQGAAGWQADFSGFIDDGTNFTFADPGSYLIDLGRDQSGHTIENLSLRGPQLHGGIFGVAHSGLTVNNVEVGDFGWSGVRLFVAQDATFTNNRFVDSGGRSEGGVTGGGINGAFLTRTLIKDNVFEDTRTGSGETYYGIKGRGFRDSRITENSIYTNFAIELPFDDDYRVEIDGNYLDGVVSVPRFNGGDLEVPGGGETFLIRNNYFTTSYAIEGPRNNVVVEQNLFDFDADDNGGNLVSIFGNEAQTTIAGPFTFADNLVSNPGRGVFWSDVPHDDISILRNHIRADETDPNPLAEGFFGFRVAQADGDATDFSTILIADNIIEVLSDDPEYGRDLLRNDASGAATIENNQLINVSDLDRYVNRLTGDPFGPSAPLRFVVGADGEEFLVEGFSISRVPEPATAATLFVGGLALLRRRR